MKGWEAIAKARGLGIPEADLERTMRPLDEMEEIFRSLTGGVTPDLEPAFELHLEPGE